MATIRSGVNRLKMMKKKEMPHKISVEDAMEEVHKNISKNVIKTGKKGKAKTKMLKAIAFSKSVKK